MVFAFLQKKYINIRISFLKNHIFPPFHNITYVEVMRTVNEFVINEFDRLIWYSFWK